MSDLTHTWVCYYNADRKLNVSVLADRMLFPGDGAYGGAVTFLSVLGPHSAVRGVLAALASRREVRSAAWPTARFYGSEGGRIVTHALSKETTHGAYLAPELLLGRDENVRSVAILNPTPERILTRLTHAHALTAKPEWASWLTAKLETERLLQRLSGFGTTGCCIDATEERLDALLSDGVRTGDLRF